MVRDDFPSISRWLDQPHVRRWWVGQDANLPAVVQKYRPRIDGSERTEMFVICSGSRLIGFIQRYRIADEPDAVNLGFGTAAIRAFVPTIYDRWRISSLLVGVQQDNRPSWHALERCGFTRIWAGRLDSDDPSDAGPAYVYQHAGADARRLRQ